MGEKEEVIWETRSGPAVGTKAQGSEGRSAMGSRGRQGLLPFRMEAASRPMDMTSQAGLPLVAELLEALGVQELAERELSIGQRRRGWSAYEKLEWLVLMIVAGGERIEDIRILARDQGLSRLLGRPTPSPDSLLDFLAAFHDEALFSERPTEGAWIAPESSALIGLHQLNREMIARGMRRLRPRAATLDLDATILETRRREALPHYEGGRGYQPVVVTWWEEDLIVADEYRDGNVPAGMGNVEITRRALAALPESVDWRGFRGDSACYDERLLQYLWREGVHFTISADMTQELRKVCTDPEVRWETFETRPTEIVEAAEVEFTPGDWPSYAPPMRYVAMRFTAIQGRLFKDGTDVKYLAVVSNRQDLAPADLLRWHWRKAGTIEHVHEVVKNELGAGIVPSQRFGANAAWFRLNLIAYNCLSLLKRHALPERLRDAKPKRLRYEIFSMAASVREHARELTARLAVPQLTVDELVLARQKLVELSHGWQASGPGSPELPLS